MSNPVIGELVTEVSEEVTIMKSAQTLIEGFVTRLDDAVKAALENGATAAELEPLASLKSDLDSNGNALAAAVAANTPVAPNA